MNAFHKNLKPASIVRIIDIDETLKVRPMQK